VKFIPPRVPLTYAEKKNLCVQMTSLSNEDLHKMIKIIQKADPSTADIDDGEYVIDVDKIDYMTLFEVEKFVRKCTSSAAKTSSRSTNKGKVRSSKNSAPLPVDTERLALAESQTNQRVNNIQKAILDIKSQQI